MKFSQLFNSRFPAILMTLLAGFLLASCAPVEEAIDKATTPPVSNIPDEPVTPAEPADPIKHVDPITPVHPVAPADPTSPGIPVDPIAPVSPTDPVKPADPVAPVGPTDPVKPVDPVAPVGPTDPVKPVDPVAPVVPVSAQISWVAPSAREDASPLSLSEIAGFKIYYGTAQGSYSNTVDVSDSTAMNYVLTGLTPGTYYIVLTTYDTQGRESQYSTEVVAAL